MRKRLNQHPKYVTEKVSKHENVEKTLEVLFRVCQPVVSGSKLKCGKRKNNVRVGVENVKKTSETFKNNPHMEHVWKTYKNAGMKKRKQTLTKFVE